MTDSPWLDLARRPARRHLLKLAAGEGPRRATAQVAPLLARRVAEGWAAQAGVDPSQVVLCGSVSEALALALGAALTPDDVVLLARPAPAAWTAGVLARGATYVDVGRTLAGAPDPAVLAACRPARLAMLAHPAATGADDVAAWRDRPDQLRLVDATLQPTLCGQPDPRVGLSLVGLRDPNRPAEALLYALVGADAPALQLVQGPAQLPPSLLRRALAALAQVTPQRTADFAAGLAARAAELQRALPLGPGQRWLPEAGVERAVQCLAADGDGLVTAAQLEGAAAASYAGFPGGGLVRVSLLR